MGYITRIELHGGTYQDYEMLHAKMITAGFKRTIVADTGKSFHLPTAEYHSGGSSLQVVLNAAKTAANATGKTSAVFVSQLSAWSSDGLEPVR